MPPGLDRAVLRVLTARVGREAAISRPNLLAALKSLGFDVHERQARAMINLLRKQGHPICSTGGSDSGYWWAANWAELNEYLEREVHSRAMDLLEQEQALKKAGERAWGPESRQGKLF
jgi:hypothetical protein